MVSRKSNEPDPAAVPREPGFALQAKQARSRQLRDSALNYASRLVREGRFDATPMAEIAREIGCSVGALYFRFRDKEALFASVIEAVVSQEVDTLGARAARGHYDGLQLCETAELCITEFVAFMRSNDALIRALYQRSGSNTDDWTVLRTAVYGMVQTWIAAVARADGRFGDREYLRQVGISFQFVSSALVYHVLIDSPVRPLGPKELVYWLTEMLLHFIALDVPSEFKPTPAVLHAPQESIKSKRKPRRKT